MARRLPALASSQLTSKGRDFLDFLGLMELRLLSLRFLLSRLEFGLREPVRLFVSRILSVVWPSFCCVCVVICSPFFKILQTLPYSLIIKL